MHSLYWVAWQMWNFQIYIKIFLFKQIFRWKWEKVLYFEVYISGKVMGTIMLICTFVSTMTGRICSKLSIADL